MDLWRSDGTEANTEMVMDIWAGTDSGTPGMFVATGNKLFLTAEESVHGQELWVINGIPSEFNWNIFLPAFLGSNRK